MQDPRYVLSANGLKITTADHNICANALPILGLAKNFVYAIEITMTAPLNSDCCGGHEICVVNCRKFVLELMTSFNALVHVSLN